MSSARSCYPHDTTDIDEKRIDDDVLALRWVRTTGGTPGSRSSRALDRLHAKGLISDPIGKAKSVMFADEGLERARWLFQEMFASSPA